MCSGSVDVLVLSVVVVLSVSVWLGVFVVRKNMWLSLFLLYVFSSGNMVLSVLLMLVGVCVIRYCLLCVV